MTMNHNLSDQDFMSIKYNQFNQTNFSNEYKKNFIHSNSNNSADISGSSNDKSQDNIIDIEQNNIHMLILQRSLYIMKKRFEQNKSEIMSIYEKYKDQNYSYLKCISTNNLFFLFKDITNCIQINFLPYENFNELTTADLMSKFNEEKYITMINGLAQFTQKNIEKYNQIFYENKIRKKRLLMKKKEKMKKGIFQVIDFTKEAKIVRKNKRGKIIDSPEAMIEKNNIIVTDDFIYIVNEDDVTILTNKNLLFNDVIPLIIADFLQEYMKNNINIGIILSNNGMFNRDIEELNANVKILYDQTIIKKYNYLNKIDPKEERKEKLKILLFECNNIDNQIKIYNELIIENAKQGMEYSYLLEMTRRLKEKKMILQKRISEINKKKVIISHSITNIKSINNSISTKNINNNNISSVDIAYYLSKLNKSNNNSRRKNNPLKLKLKHKKLSKTEIRDNNLYEIFAFYCKQHVVIGKTPTFDELCKKGKHMNLSEFSKFCIEFKILLKTTKINEIFKKYTKNPPYMSFMEFMEILKKISILMNEEKKQYVKERMNIYKLKLQEIIEKEEKIKKKLNKKIKIKKINVNIVQKLIQNKDNNEEVKNVDTNIKQNENPNEKKIENHEDAIIIYKDDNDNNIKEEKKDENNNNNNKKLIFLN